MRQLITRLLLSEKDAYINWVRLFDPDEPWNEPDITKGLKTVFSPLYYVSLAGLIEAVRLILERGTDVNAQGGRYGNALKAASANGHDHM